MLSLSETCTAKLKLPAAVGVPEMAPLLLSERPAGNFPDLTVQEYGEVPPVADRDVLYAVEVCPWGKDVVVMARGTGGVLPTPQATISPDKTRLGSKRNLIDFMYLPRE